MVRASASRLDPGRQNRHSRRLERISAEYGYWDAMLLIRNRTPVEHFMMPPPGLEPARFAEYADIFAKEVIPAFR